MASLKPVLKNDFVKADGKYNIKIRISHEGKVRYISSPWSIEKKYFNSNGTISGKYPGQAKLNIALNLLMAEYNSILEGIGKDVRNMDINNLVSRLKNSEGGEASFSKYLKERVRALRSEGRISYADTFLATHRQLEKFTEKTDILFKDITLDFLNRFDLHLRTDSKRINTSRIYKNCIKNLLLTARDNDIIKTDLSYLRKYKIRSEKTEHRNIDIKDIKKIMALKLSPERQRALDLFMLSIYLLGANFKDMLFWTPENIKKGRIEYMRYKTKNKKPIKMSVKLVPEAQTIIDRYKGEKYLLRFIESKTAKRKTPGYKDITAETNVLLKKIAKTAGIDVKLTTYYARGSVATIAYNLKIMESTISEMLGHSDGIPITNVYIKRSFKNIDEAQRMVINAIKP